MFNMIGKGYTVKSAMMEMSMVAKVILQKCLAIKPEHGAKRQL
jgi:hypothetical protein